jgi:hypothetical protein
VTTALDVLVILGAVVGVAVLVVFFIGPRE